MWKFRRNRKLLPRYLKQNKAPSDQEIYPELRTVQKTIYRQAMLAGLTIILTVVILFAMTSAWYTNIIQTSGLVFQAESWGFEGTIDIDETTPILAAPGDDGVINMEVQNTGDSLSAVTVNISKAGMLEEMQKRLFFYVDTRMIRNEETMERVYLNNLEGYTYTLFNQGKLTMTEKLSNAPLIKWHWVYDVLGYYVIAKPGETIKDASGKTKLSMDIQEYLRPIEYDYDKATTAVDTTGDNVSVALKTVDGKTSPEIYIWQISAKDGYPGQIDPEKDKLANGFYAVDVDDAGYGVYAYLCDYAEIEYETTIDTKLGETAYKYMNGEELSDLEKMLLNHTVTMTISAQKNDATVISVGTVSALETAIAQNKTDVIQLKDNISLKEGKTLTIPTDSRIMLDLNGNTLTGTSGSIITAQPGSSLTVINGTLQGTENNGKTYGIYATGAEIVMSDVDVNNLQYGIYLGDNINKNELDSRLHMLGCNIDADVCAVFASGNGFLSEQKTQVVIEKSNLSSNNIAVCGNGDTAGNGRWGTDIQIIDSVIAGNVGDGTVTAGGIYQPQKDSTLLISNSTVSGYNGIAIKGGTVRIVDSVIEGLGVDPEEPSFGGSGYSNTGDAVYIETNYDYEIELDISGGKTILMHKDDNSYSLRVFEPDASNVSVKIHAGRFDEWQPDAYIAENAVQAKVDESKYCFVNSPEDETE